MHILTVNNCLKNGENIKFLSNRKFWRKQKTQSHTRKYCLRQQSSALYSIFVYCIPIGNASFFHYNFYFEFFGFWNTHQLFLFDKHRWNSADHFNICTMLYTYIADHWSFLILTSSIKLTFLFDVSVLLKRKLLRISFLPNPDVSYFSWWRLYVNRILKKKKRKNIYKNCFKPTDIRTQQ